MFRHGFLSRGIRPRLRFLAVSLLATFSTAVIAAPESRQFRDWAVTCDSKQPRCVLALTASSDAENLWLATLRLVRTSADSARVQVIVPAGVHLASGMFVGVRPPLSELTYERCSSTICVAAGNLDARELTKWKRGATAEIRYRPNVTSPPIVVDLSLMGVTAALNYAESQDP